MPGGKAYGADREYQVLCRDILVRRASPLRLVPYSGDGIDVAFRLGSADRTFDVALTNEQGKLVVAECRRTKDPVKLVDLDAFAHRVELLRQEPGLANSAVDRTAGSHSLAAAGHRDRHGA